MTENASPAPQKAAPACFLALVPFLVFTAFYLGLSIWAGDFYKTPMPIAFLVASAFAMFLNFRQSLADKVEIYAHGMGDVNIMIMCLIFILSGAFAAIAKRMGAVDAAVLIARHLIPDNLMVIGMFLVSCFISLAIGTSCGTISALTPIGLGLIEPLKLSPALALGAIVGGAMFGDNLSMISDTTIAATRTQGVQMRDKFFSNIRIVIPALVITLVIYGIVARQAPVESSAALAPVTWHHSLSIVPYLLILICALFGLNVMFLLFAGTIMAFIIGCIAGTLGDLPFWNGLDTLGKGCLSMSETLIVAILAGGLLTIIRHNGGIDYLIKAVEKLIRTPRSCEIGVMFLVSLINLFTANNTVAIVIAGPIARTLSERYECSPKRIASILDTASCVIQGLIPYGAQILIATGLAKTAGVEVAPNQLIVCLYYPMALALAMIVGIFLFGGKKQTR